jgi:hypothetical protein
MQGTYFCRYYKSPSTSLAMASTKPDHMGWTITFREKNKVVLQY